MWVDICLYDDNKFLIINNEEYSKVANFYQLIKRESKELLGKWVNEILSKFYRIENKAENSKVFIALKGKENFIGFEHTTNRPNIHIEKIGDNIIRIEGENLEVRGYTGTEHIKILLTKEEFDKLFSLTLREVLETLTEKLKKAYLEQIKERGYKKLKLGKCEIRYPLGWIFEERRAFGDFWGIEEIIVFSDKEEKDAKYVIRRHNDDIKLNPKIYGKYKVNEFEKDGKIIIEITKKSTTPPS